jgi:Zn-dependent protease with chaperone function
MILPYVLRLVCLCFASFFALNALVHLVVRFSSSSILRFAEGRQAKAAARFLFSLRMLPFAVATLFVLGMCVPSYLWLEPAATSERVGVVCVILGLLGATTWCLAVTRALFSLLSSLRHSRICLQAANEARLPGESSPILVLNVDAPIFAVSGLFRQRLLISRSLLDAFSAEELAAALRHEHAHHSSRDNAKRLLILLAPDIFPFVHSLRLLDRGWSKIAEWAADDQATSGDSLRALALAAALVRVARMGASPRLPILSTSLLLGDLDLSARVNRLLHTAPLPNVPSRDSRSLIRGVGFLSATCLIALLLTPATLSAVHELLELLLH